MIDALEAGVDTLIMSMGLCRLGYYGELQEKMLHELGYEFDFINFSEYSTGNPKDYLKALHRINPKASAARMTRVGAETLRMLSCLDEMEEEYYKHRGFELDHGDFKAAWDQFLISMETAENLHDIELSYKTAKKAFAAIPINKPEKRKRYTIRTSTTFGETPNLYSKGSFPLLCGLTVSVSIFPEQCSLINVLHGSSCSMPADSSL